MFHNVFHGCRVFVTGHTGFKGSWLSLWLTGLGADVTGFSLDDATSPNHFELLELGGVKSLTGDIRERGHLASAMAEARPDIAFHLAAQSLVRRSYAQPSMTMETNIMGTVNLLEAVRATPGVRAVVVVTSDKCYRNVESMHAYREDDPLGGHDPYSASKACAEIATASYARSFFHAGDTPLVRTVRAGNVIGGGDWADDRLIPDMVRAAHAGEDAVIRNPGACRPWQHVLDPLSGYLLLGQRLLQGDGALSEAFNFGPSEHGAIRVKEMAELFAANWEDVRLQMGDVENGCHEAQFLRLDSSLACEELGWKAVWDTRTAVERTAEWYRMHRRGAVVSNEQLESYVSQARDMGMPWAGGGS